MLKRLQADFQLTIVLLFGFFFDTYSVLQGIDRVIPVDVYVPGCPPRPEQIIDGVLKIQELVGNESLRRRYSKEAHRGGKSYRTGPSSRRRHGAGRRRRLDQRADPATVVAGAATGGHAGRWRRATAGHGLSP